LDKKPQENLYSSLDYNFPNDSKVWDPNPASFTTWYHKLTENFPEAFKFQTGVSSSSERKVGPNKAHNSRHLVTKTTTKREMNFTCYQNTQQQEL
jgi:hypothetical protein